MKNTKVKLNCKLFQQNGFDRYTSYFISKRTFDNNLGPDRLADPMAVATIAENQSFDFSGSPNWAW